MVNQLKDIVFPDDHILVSFDVKSLFTNIPRDLVADSIKKRFPNLGNVTKLPLNEIIASTSRVEIAPVSPITKKFPPGSLPGKLKLYCMAGNWVGIVRVES